MPLFDPSGRLFLRFDDPVKESVELKLRNRAMNLRLGFTTINEERAEEGYPPVPWGDEPLRVSRDPGRSGGERSNDQI